MPDTPIGTNSPDYTLVTADLGADIYCKVTATNASGTANADSNTVGPVTAVVLPGGTFAYVASTNVSGPDPGVSPDIDTTGAGLLVVGVSSYGLQPDNVIVTDSKGNTWTSLTASAVGDARCRLYYSIPTSVGTAHNVTAADAVSGSFYATVTFAAYSISTPPAILDLQAGDTGSVSPASAGAGITPSTTNALVVFCGCISAAGAMGSPTGGFTVRTSVAAAAGTYEGQTFADLIQTTAALADPDWTVPAGDWAARIVSFKT